MLNKCLHLTMGLLALAASSSAAAIFNVTIDTSPLIGHVAAPFALDLQFTDGSGSGDSNNTVTLSGFSFGGGAPAGSIFTTGGVSGDLSSSVQLTDSVFFNEFTENFAPGSSLSFQIQLTGNQDSGTPDEFALFLLDKSGFNVPTLDAGNALLVMDIGSGGITVSRFQTNTTQNPPGGGSPINIAAPTVTPLSTVPEPGTFVLIGVALGALFLRRIR